jgi:hypothetical protein
VVFIQFKNFWLQNSQAFEIAAFMYGTILFMDPFLINVCSRFRSFRTRVGTQNSRQREDTAVTSLVIRTSTVRSCFRVAALLFEVLLLQVCSVVYGALM